MPDTWVEVLNQYSYPVDLCLYDRNGEFPAFFELNIAGDRESTIMFENHFRQKAPNHVEAFFEVVFWKLYSQPHRRKKETDRRVDYVQKKNIRANQLWYAVQLFVEKQSKKNLQRIRERIGISTDVLALPLTFPALASPETLPMVDKQVAEWVNLNYVNHNINRVNNLTSFNMNYTSLRQNDFPNYKNWVAWCREVAQVLTGLTDFRWRARDVEMAVFTAQRKNNMGEIIELNPLP